MFYWLMKRETAWTQTLIMLPASFLMTLFTRLFSHSAEDVTLPFSFLSLACVGMLMQIQPRVTLFQASLPIPARQLFAARLASSLALVWSPALGMCASDILVGRAAAATSVPLLLCMSSFATLSVVLILSYRPTAMVGPARFPFVLLLAAAAWYIMAFRPQALAAVSVIAVAASTILFLIAWVKLSGSFQCAPVKAGARPINIRCIVPAFTWRPIFRAAFAWKTLGFLPMVFILGLNAGWVFGALFAGMIYSEARIRTRWMLSLPMRLRTVLLVSMAAAVLPFATVIMLREQFDRSPHTWELIRFGETRCEIHVAATLWRWAPGGSSPVITSPWGESYRPKVHSLLSVPVYSPYEAGNSSTDRFIEWQFGRATMAAYGRVIAPRDFSRSVNSGLKPVTARPSARVLRWAAFVALFLIFAWNVEFSWWHKFECLSTTGRSAISLLSGLPVMAGVLATLVWNPLDNGGVMVEELPQALFACVVRLLPDNLLVVAAIAIAPILALFLAVERQSRKSELTGPLLQSWPSIFGN